MTNKVNAVGRNSQKYTNLWTVPDLADSKDQTQLELVYVPKGASTRNGLHPAALLGGGVLIGGVGAAAARRMLNKSSLQNARFGKTGKKKKMNGVLRDLLDAPVSAGVRSRRR